MVTAFACTAMTAPLSLKVMSRKNRSNKKTARPNLKKCIYRLLEAIKQNVVILWVSRQGSPKILLEFSRKKTSPYLLGIFLLAVWLDSPSAAI